MFLLLWPLQFYIWHWYLLPFEEELLQVKKTLKKYLCGVRCVMCNVTCYVWRPRVQARVRDAAAAPALTMGGVGCGVSVLGVMSHGLMCNCARVFFVKIPSSQAQYAVVAPHRALCIVAARAHRINCALTTSAPRAETSARVTPEHLCFVMSIAPSTETRCHTSQCGMEKYLLVKYIYTYISKCLFEHNIWRDWGRIISHV